MNDLLFQLQSIGGETDVAYANSETLVVSLKVNKINYLILSLGQPKLTLLGKVGAQFDIIEFVTGRIHDQ